jgi:hypothetical protein
MPMWDTLDTVNSSQGISSIFLYVNNVTSGLFFNLFLFAFFLIACFGGYYSKKRSDGYANFAASFAVAGFLTAGITIFLSLIPNLIPTYTLIITIVISGLGVLWMFFGREQD